MLMCSSIRILDRVAASLSPQELRIAQQQLPYMSMTPASTKVASLTEVGNEMRSYFADDNSAKITLGKYVILNLPLVRIVIKYVRIEVREKLFAVHMSSS